MEERMKTAYEFLEKNKNSIKVVVPSRIDDFSMFYMLKKCENLLVSDNETLGAHGLNDMPKLKRVTMSYCSMQTMCGVCECNAKSVEIKNNRKLLKMNPMKYFNGEKF